MYHINHKYITIINNIVKIKIIVIENNIIIMKK
jgi:hypothetical protein